jgi:ferric-dicitrate binding protein FerR (iron transport regulator)
MPSDRPRLRYGCLESREDRERVISGRAPADVVVTYAAHLERCEECRRADRTLRAVFAGPRAPAPLSPAALDHTFTAALARRPLEAARLRHSRQLTSVALVGLSAASMALTWTLLSPWRPPVAEDFDELSRGDELELTAPRWRAPRAGTSGSAWSAAAGGIDHPAQAYGRVVGGRAALALPSGEPWSSSTFEVGTRFRVGAEESVQVGLAGKMVANFSAQTEVTWSSASPELIELELDRGLLAVRYDRRPSDPILQVRTPTAVVRVVGTVFTVQVEPDDSTTVAVLRGEVEVRAPEDMRLVAEVEAGYRFDVARSMYTDVARDEVAAALPLSNEASPPPGPAGTFEGAIEPLADGKIPDSWRVPGLPDDAEQRDLAHVPTLPSRSVLVAQDVQNVPPAPEARRAPTEPAPIAVPDDEGEDLLDALARDAERTRKRELVATLEHCRKLHESPDTRYLAARCLSKFVAVHGDDPLAVEGFLLVGILRMDYALDFRAADTAFEDFLRRAPYHPRAEYARFRLWLAATEDGRISTALERGRDYIRRYPTGRYVGKILRRFPELKSEL